MQTAAIDAGSVRAMLQRLNRVEITLAKVARERDTAPEFVQQNGLVNLYVRKMRVKLDLAQLQMTIGDETFDLGALTSAVEAMGDITARFETGVRAWTGRVSALLTSSTENVAEAVRRVVRGARTLGKMVVRDPRVAGSEMVLIRTGTFIMGIPEAESKREGTEDWDVHARPLHRVTISRSFLLRRYPVTRGEFALFITETKRDWRSPEFEQTDRHPAVLVGYDDAVAYAAWLSQRTGHRYRLPSESEWEYACRAGTQTARYWGDVADPNMANFDSNGTKEVGSYPANPWGLCDMIGNGYEWVEDRWHDTYEGAPKDGSAWTTGIDTRRVVRGGSRNQDYKYLRSGNRGLNGRPPSPWVGFRLARDL
jgi:formylglycine-generating enzyme required for sulfatase activity